MLPNLSIVAWSFSLSPTMNGSSHFTNAFANDGYNTLYRTHPIFPSMNMSFSPFPRTLHLHFLQLPLHLMTCYFNQAMRHILLWMCSIQRPNMSYRHKGMISQHAWCICAYNSWFYFRNLNAQLQDMINRLTSQHPRVLSMPNTTTSNQEKPDSLVVSNQSQPLDEEDYLEVLYWCEESWVKHTKEERECGRNPLRLRFLTDDNGNPVIEARIKMFMLTAKQAWNELYHLQLDPSSWTKKTPKAASYLIYILKRNFNKFCYCDGDWKVECFAIMKYPDWCREGRESGHLTCASEVLSFVFF